MLVLFILIFLAGHFYVSLLIIAINMGIFHEILSLKRNYEKEVKIMKFRFLSWYFFAVAIFFFYGKLFSSKLTKYTLTSKSISVIIY